MMKKLYSKALFRAIFSFALYPLMSQRSCKFSEAKYIALEEEFQNGILILSGFCRKKQDLLTNVFSSLELMP